MIKNIFVSIETFSSCKTNGGASPNTSCVFPFKFDGKLHKVCRNETDGYWCSTKVDSDGFHIGEQGNWGYCGENCPFPGMTS